MFLFTSVALQELPWLAANGAAAAAVDASPLQRRGSKSSGRGKMCGRHQRDNDGDSSSSADISDALLGGGDRKRTTVVDVERGGETQSRMRGSGSQPGTPV